jgi:hypothetical protein
MKPFARLAAVLASLLLASCNLPLAQPTSGPSVNEQAATLVAATLQAAATATAPAVTPFASPVVPDVTPTTKPTLLINTDNASCNSGPSADFNVIATFAAGTSVDLIGKDSADSYWIVVDPTSHNLCWVQAQDGTASGSYQTLPQMTPPAASNNPKTPAGPGYVIWTFSCAGSQITVTLTWPDKADNEKGYHVYRDGSQIAELPPNSTSYTDTTSDAGGKVIVYAVAAYNDVGSSPQAATASSASGKNTPISCQ